MQMKIVLAAALIASGVVACAAESPPAPSAKARADLEAAAAHLAESASLNGALLVAKGDEVLIERGIGIADPRTGTAFTSQTPSRIASLTKQFTAATVLRLVEEDRLALDQTIGDLLAWYPAGPARAVTVRQLLNHSGGLPRPERGDMVEMASTTARDRIEGFAALPLDFESGTRHSYSNSGYTVLGAIIEEITGQSYEEAVTALLLEPNGLSGTTPLRDGETRQRLASGVRLEGGTYVADDYRQSDRGAPWAAGMMTSTVRDLMRWTRSLHGGEVFESPETLMLMTDTPGGWEDNRAFDQWAYASGLFQARRNDGRTFIFHDGRLGSYLADLRYYPAHDLTIVVLETAGGDVTAAADLLEDAAFAMLAAD